MTTKLDDLKAGNDTAKPLNGYDFGEDWLDETEEALEFDWDDKFKSTDKIKASKSIVAKSKNASDVHSPFDMWGKNDTEASQHHEKQASISDLLGKIYLVGNKKHNSLHIVLTKINHELKDGDGCVVIQSIGSLIKNHNLMLGFQIVQNFHDCKALLLTRRILLNSCRIQII